MKIGYTRSVDDHVAFNVWHTCGSAALRRGRLGANLIAALFLFGVFGWISYKDGSWMPLLIVVVVWVGLMLLGKSSRGKALQRNLAKMYSEGDNRTMHGMHYLDVRAEGLFASHEMGEGRMDWRALERVVNTADYYFIYTGAADAVIVPKGKVVEGDFEGFRLAVEQRMRAVRTEEGGGFDERRIVSVDRPVLKQDGRARPWRGVFSVGAGIAAGGLCGVGIGLAIAAGEVSEAGLKFVMLALMANLVGVLTGVWGLWKDKPKTAAVIGVVVNGLLLAGFAGIAVLGRLAG